MQVSFAELLLAKVCCSSSRIFSISGCGSNTYEQLCWLGTPTQHLVSNSGQKQMLKEL